MILIVRFGIENSGRHVDTTDGHFRRLKRLKQNVNLPAYPYTPAAPVPYLRHHQQPSTTINHPL